MPDLFTGFAAERSDQAKRFDGRAFWDGKDRDSLLHLHGSVHMGFSNNRRDAPLGELFWYDDRAEALKHSTYMGTANRRMDGTQYEISAIITGLDKLSRLQPRPLSYFYSALAEDALRADIIILVGCGLGDLHLNNWLTQARLEKQQMPPIIVVDYWGEGFARASALNERDRKLIDIWHALRLSIGYQPFRDMHPFDGWTVAQDRSGAVWDRGFGAFLEAPDQFAQVLDNLSSK